MTEIIFYRYFTFALLGNLCSCRLIPGEVLMIDNLIFLSASYCPPLHSINGKIYGLCLGNLPLNYYEFKLFRLLGIDPQLEMDWKKYLNSLLLINLFGFLLILLVQLFQGWLPLNPQNFSHVPFWSAFNTAASFVTNTN